MGPSDECNTTGLLVYNHIDTQVSLFLCFAFIAFMPHVLPSALFSAYSKKTKFSGRKMKLITLHVLWKSLHHLLAIEELCMLLF